MLLPGLAGERQEATVGIKGSVEAPVVVVRYAPCRGFRIEPPRRKRMEARRASLVESYRLANFKALAVVGPLSPTVAVVKNEFTSVRAAQCV